MTDDLTDQFRNSAGERINPNPQELTPGQRAILDAVPVAESRTFTAIGGPTLAEVFTLRAQVAALQAERDERIRVLTEILQRIVDWDDSGLALTEDHIAQARTALEARNDK